MSLVPVQMVDQILAEVQCSWGIESIPFQAALGRVLASPLQATRDMPPFNRVTMDGIAIRFKEWEAGIKAFRIAATMAAGQEPPGQVPEGACVELMTGCALPPSLDTVIRYEDIRIHEGIATLEVEQVKAHVNVHRQASDRHRGDIIARRGQVVDPAIIGLAASEGHSMLPVCKLPTVAVLSTGDELVPVDSVPGPTQVRRSNGYVLAAMLASLGIAADVMFLPDDDTELEAQLKRHLEQYDMLLLTGGVSKGKFDYLPEVLTGLGVQKLFHGVQQRPGKPFWVGTASGKPVFAFPGNPVSVFLCMTRYCLPWLRKQLGMNMERQTAVLGADVTFTPDLTYFMQVVLKNEQGSFTAYPAVGNGSGDYANLADAQAFLELPTGQTVFKIGVAYPVWIFR